MKPLLAFVFSLILCLAVILFGAYKDMQLEYHTLQNIFEKSLECRSSVSGERGNTTEYVNKICGDIPNLNSFIGNLQ